MTSGPDGDRAHHVPVRWSDDGEAAQWIAERLAPPGSGVVSIVPMGFAAYARVLHPVAPPHDGGRAVRWRDIAAWSGQPLAGSTPFHAIALPPDAPALPPPSTAAPICGPLGPADAARLADVLAPFTATADACWFGLWDGYAHTAVALVGGPTPSRRRADPIPEAVEAGPRLHLDGRSYSCYRGSVRSYQPFGHGPSGPTADLWWPSDHAWFVGSDTDLSSTYVGGSPELIDAVLAADGLEALRVEPGDSLGEVAPWIQALAERGAGELQRCGACHMATSRGVVDATVRRPAWLRRGELAVAARGDHGNWSTSRQPLGRSGRQEGSEELRAALVRALVGLVE